MRIIYFTTSCQKEDYIMFSEKWNTTLNTTIQNVHNRIIRALALTHEVDVISIRPFSKKYCDLKSLPNDQNQEGKITWHYLTIKRNKIARFISSKNQAKKLVAKMDLKNTIIITDTLNPYILNSSVTIAKKYHLPIVGICINTPSGIHNTGRSYTNFLLSLAKDLSGYIVSTSGLDELYNQENRASMVLEGILDDKFKQIETPDYGKYIFYNGSLEAKYGIYDLIKAFNELNRDDIKLLIAGYHSFEQEKFDKAINENKNIVYLGMLNNDEILSYENKSLVNVNPRPYSEDYDRYLIPVSMIDYLGSNSITVSVKNSKLQPLFNDCCIWIDSSDKDDLVNGINKALNMGKEREQMIKKANAEANKQFSMSVINKKIILFLKQFLRQKD